MIYARAWFKDPTNFECYHRTNGPAIEISDGTKQWWRKGIMLGDEREWFPRHYTEDGLRQRIKDLEERVRELEEKLSLDAGTGV